MADFVHYRVIYAIRDQRSGILVESSREFQSYESAVRFFKRKSNSDRVLWCDVLGFYQDGDFEYLT